MQIVKIVSSSSIFFQNSFESSFEIAGIPPLQNVDANPLIIIELWSVLIKPLLEDWKDVDSSELVICLLPPDAISIKPK